MAARRSFDQELAELNESLIEMGNMVAQAIENAILAFKSEDLELAKTVVQGDREVDHIEKQIESMCLSIILRQQPVAGDLRTVTSALKMVTDMERIGDQASDIAELILSIEGERIYDVVKNIPSMAEVAIAMVNDSITAFVERDLDLAKAVAARDCEVDELFDETKKELVGIIRRGEEMQDNAIEFLMIAKYLERIADHAVNICEWVNFLQTGKQKKK